MKNEREAVGSGMLGILERDEKIRGGDASRGTTAFPIWPVVCVKTLYGAARAGRVEEWKSCFTPSLPSLVCFPTYGCDF